MVGFGFSNHRPSEWPSDFSRSVFLCGLCVLSAKSYARFQLAPDFQNAARTGRVLFLNPKNLSRKEQKERANSAPHAPESRNCHFKSQS